MPEMGCETAPQTTSTARRMSLVFSITGSGSCNAASYFLPLARSEKTRRLDEQHEDENGKNDRVAQRRIDVSDDQHLRQADQNSAERGPREISDPPQYGGHKCLQAGIHTHERVDRRLLDGGQDARGAREGRTQAEREGDDHIDVDAHEL